MQTETAQRLLELNRQFYQTFAAPFSATRQRIQPGVRRLLDRLVAGDSLLDLGCGNGELARVLRRHGWTGRYTGVDFSAGLLQDADDAAGVFLQADLASPHWPERAGIGRQPFAAICAFAVLHHLPGQALRVQFLRQGKGLLAPDGLLFLSNWQFLNSPRLAARVQPWGRVGITPESVAPNDYLLDWRSGGNGLRYAHHFTVDELAGLAGETGFRVCETFFSDGESGDLGLYQIWAHHPSS
ncbi:MAG: class I SAM-dependent methyltransferase [Chloroflexota bacterium]